MPLTEYRASTGTTTGTTTRAASDERLDTHEHPDPWLQERIPGWVAIAVAVAWIVLMEIAVALEPTTAQPVPLVGVGLEVVMYVLLAAMLAGFVAQRRWALLASLAAALLGTGGTVACPVTGHHGFGLWWLPQMACVLTLVGMSAVALHREYS